ncbi:hypothetical protein DH2020_027683 [Rehmannia glutinosa]|uniref:RIN4 pathogenic type III effector avirulence factor Avr cleavage site domain-containing protein n=1 Tax=Rehmannia glutinosa TaxID=99300 RepID=A0ABR0VUG3_REHGL
MSSQIYQTHPQDSIDVERNEQKAPEPKTRNYAQSESDKLEVEALKPRHDRRPTREEGDMKRFMDSPLRQEKRNSSNSPMIVARQSVGSDRSVDHSPLHPHSQGRAGGKSSGISSPSWERKATLEGIAAPSTPGRSRLRSVTRGDDSPDRSAAVPKFGEWDETDPTAAEGYTQIFNRVREEKHSETGKVPVMPTETSLSNGQKQYGNDNPKLNLDMACKQMSLWSSPDLTSSP